MQRNRRARLRLDAKLRPRLLQRVHEQLRTLHIVRKVVSERVEVEPADVEIRQIELPLLPLALRQSPGDLLQHAFVQRLPHAVHTRRDLKASPCLQPLEADEDVERNGHVPVPAREPRIEPVVRLRRIELCKALLLRSLEPLGVVDRADAIVDLRQVRGQRIRVIAAERLLAALVRELHQVGQRLDRVPGGTRHDAGRQVDVADRVPVPDGLKQVGKRELLLARPAQVELHRLAHLDLPRKDRQTSLLGVRKVRPDGLRHIRDARLTVGDHNRELHRSNLLRLQRNLLFRCCAAELQRDRTRLV